MIDVCRRCRAPAVLLLTAILPLLAHAATTGDTTGDTAGNNGATESAAAGLHTGGTATSDNPTLLRVGIKQAQPFAVQQPSGEWTGLAVDLWTQIGERLGVQTRFVEHDSAGQVIDAVEAGEVDAAIGALTVTPERERRIDFTQPYYNAGLGIATVSGNAGLWSTLGRLVSWQFVSAVAILALVLLAVGAAMWLVERRRNGEQFGGPASRGIGNGFWWSAVTMTTVGYGDKAPITPAGRVIALVWMFVSIITISGFTAAIASAFTVDQLASRVTGPDDLPKVRVATVSDTASADYLAEQGLRARGFASPSRALSALAAGDADAVVHDAPILRALLLAGDTSDVVVLDALVRQEDYAFAVPQNSPLRERINPVLLEIVQSADWAETRHSYVGR